MVPPEFGAIPVFNESGEPVASVRDLVTSVVREPKLRSQHSVAIGLPEGPVPSELQANNPTLIRGDGEPQNLYMRFPTGVSPTLSRLTRLSIWCNAEHKSAPIPMRHGQYQDVVYSWGEVLLEDGPVAFIATQDTDGAIRFTFEETPRPGTT